MNPVSLNDIALFFDSVLNVFGQYVVYAFSIMVAFSLLFGIRKLILGDKA